MPRTQKSIHQTSFDLSSYAGAIGLPESEIESISIWAKERAADANQRIRVLAVGVGGGRLELPLIEALAEGRETVDATVIDYSKDSMEALQRALHARGYERESDEAADDVWVRGNIRLSRVLEDFETWACPPNAQYDLATAFFVINFFSSWPSATRKILSLIKTNGTLLVSEDIGDIRFLDNTFDPPDPELAGDLVAGTSTDRTRFCEFWKRYYEQRLSHGFRWGPLLSPSRMAPLTGALETLSSLGVGRKDKIESRWWVSSTSWREWLAIVRERSVFHCLSSLPFQERDRLANDLEEWLLNELPESQDLSAISPRICVGQVVHSYQLTAAKDTHDRHVELVLNSEYVRAVTERLAERSVFRLEFAEQEPSQDEQRRRLLSVHELLPTRGLTCLSLISWYLDDLDDVTKGGWYKNVPVFLPTQLDVEGRLRYCASYSFYMCLARPNESLFSDLILHLFPRKLFIELEVLAEERAAVRFSSDGRPTGIVLSLQEDKVREIRAYAAEILNAGIHPLKISGLFDPYCDPSVPTIGLPMILQGAGVLASACRDQITSLNAGIDRLATALADVLGGVLEKHLPPDARPASATRTARELAVTAYRNCVVGASTIAAWTRALFVPASSVRGVSRIGAETDVGLLGYICYHTEPDGETCERAWSQLRQVLAIKVNLHGLQDAVHQYFKLALNAAPHSASLKIAILSFRHMIPGIANSLIADVTSVRGHVSDSEVRQRLENIETCTIALLMKAAEVKSLLSRRDQGGLVTQSSEFESRPIKEYYGRALSLATTFSPDLTPWEVSYSPKELAEEQISGVFFSALLNIFTNVVQHAWVGVPAQDRRAVTWIRRSQGSPAILVCVGNTGTPFKRDPFGDFTLSVEQDSGFGLQVVQALVTGEGGNIRLVRSNSLEGEYPAAPRALLECTSCVEFTLPIQVA